MGLLLCVKFQLGLCAHRASHSLGALFQHRLRLELTSNYIMDEGWIRAIGDIPITLDGFCHTHQSECVVL